MKLFLFIFLISFISYANPQKPIKDKLVKLPIRIQENQIESGKFYITCDFDSVKDKNCHLDTGSTYTSVKWSKEIKNYPITGTKIRTSASGIETKEEMITFNSFASGDYSKKEFQVVRYSKDRNQESRIGMSFLMDSILNFKFNENILEVSKSITNGAKTEHDLYIDSKKLFYIKLNVWSAVAKLEANILITQL